jgi:hypothetical protein
MKSCEPGVIRDEVLVERTCRGPPGGGKIDEREL